MSKHIILAQSRSTATALTSYLEMAKEQYGGGDVCDSTRRPMQVAWTSDVSGFGLETYRVIADEISEKAADLGGTISLGQVTILVDTVDLNQLDPLATGGWDSVIAMLILTFPEIRWLFGVFQGATDGLSRNLVRDHGLQKLFGDHVDPIFDGTGLREWVRLRAKESSSGPVQGTVSYIPFRNEVAVAIDDERSFGYFHGYTAYRFGFRTYAVTEELLMTKLLGKDGRLQNCDEFRLTMEDMFLSFPDRSSSYKDTHWSNLAQRSDNLPVLDQGGLLRVFVTAGQKNGSDAETREGNRVVCQNLMADGRLGKMLFKPMSGIFDLWKAAGFLRELRGGRLRGQATGFIWPPAYLKTSGSGLKRSHSAPGRLLEVAARLALRAQGLKQNVNSAIHAVQGAVLAVDAMELLGENAQTTFLEALALKHEFEAMAECHFYGIQKHFDVKSRMNEIRIEVRELGRYYSMPKRKEAEWNAEAAILNGLSRTYQSHHQFEEELTILVRSRAIHRRLWFKKRLRAAGDELRWLNPLYWVACYVHGLLRSLPLFIIALFLWVGGLSVLYGVTSPGPPVGRSAALYRGLEEAVSSFFSVGNPTRHGDIAPSASVALNTAPTNTNLDSRITQLDDRLARLEANTVQIHKKVFNVDYPKKYVAVICLAIVAGFIHIGVFISHLYTIVSRK